MKQDIVKTEDGRLVTETLDGKSIAQWYAEAQAYKEAFRHARGTVRRQFNQIATLTKETDDV